MQVSNYHLFNMSHEDRLINSLFSRINIATYKCININQEHTTGENIKWYQRKQAWKLTEHTIPMNDATYYLD